MAKDTVSQWDTTAANNTDVGGINIAEGCPPSNVNDAMREMMAQIKANNAVVEDRANHTGTATIDDDELLIVDPSDDTKKLRFDAGNVTASNTRVITVADNNMNLAKVVTGEYAQSLSSGEKAQARANLAAVTHVYATPQSFVGQTALDFSSLPSGIIELTVSIFGLKTNGTTVPLIRLGESSGGLKTSGYFGSAANLINTPAVTVAASETGLLLAGAWGTTVAAYGFMQIKRHSPSDHKWIGTASMGREDSTTGQFVLGGAVELSGELDRLRFTTGNGTDAGVAGEIGLSYKYIG